MAYKTITLLGDPLVKEYTCNAAITPGHLCEVMSTGKARKHATSGGNAQTMFALEDDHQGKGIADDYAAAAQGQFGIFKRGEEVLAILADGQNVAIGAYLESNGNGELKAISTDVPSYQEIKSIVAIALEAKDMSGSSGADPSPRIRVEIV